MASYIRGRVRTLSDAEIVRLYVEGLDSESVGARANANPTTVLNLVRAAGETVRSRGKAPPEKDLAIPAAEIVRRYRAGESGPMLADAAHCSAATIYGVLRRAGVKRRAVASYAQSAATAAVVKRRQRRNAS